MFLKYDVFEMFTDGSTLWRGTIAGEEIEAVCKLEELASQTKNEVRMFLDHTLIAKMNAPEG